MKKLLFIAIVMVIAIGIFVVPVSANDEILVLLNGELLEFDVQPQIINGRTMVPMRKIFEALGASVEWENDTQLIRAKKDGKIVVMQINSTLISVDGQNITLDVPPQLVDGRTLVPVRAVAESFDIHVIWDSDDSIVLLSTYIPFETSIQAFNHLSTWLLENGKAYGEYVYVGWKISETVGVEICYYPENDYIAFHLSNFESDGLILTTVFISPTYDGRDVFATYMSRSKTSKINGDINMAMYTNNYPLAYRECEPGEFETTYNMLEDTRQRINILLDETDILLSFENTGVTLKTLGFEKR